MSCKKMTKEHTRQVLEQALVELDKRGWCQGVSVNDEGHVCVLGSFDAAVGELWKATGNNRVVGGTYARIALHKIINNVRKYDESLTSIANWNDDPARSVEDVKLAIKRAIELCEDSDD